MNKTSNSTRVGYTLLELMIAAVIAGLLAASVYRYMTFATSAYSAEAAKLNNLQDASLLLARLRKDIHNLRNMPDGSSPVIRGTDGSHIFSIHKVDHATGHIGSIRISYSVVGDDQERRVIRKVMDGPDTDSSSSYGRGSFDSFALEPVDIDGVKGFRARISFIQAENAGENHSPSAQRSAVTFDTLLFPRNTGTEIKGDNWEYFSLAR